MEPMELIAKLFELQQLVSRKTDSVRDLAFYGTRERVSELELKFRRHQAAYHGYNFNESGYLEALSRAHERHAELMGEYRDLCEQINALEVEMESKIGALAGA